MSLRPKLILSFLFVSLITLAAVGSVAWWLTRYELREIARDLAFGAFQEDVANYLRQYGSWAEGERQLPLGEYLRALREPHRPRDIPAEPPHGPRPGFPPPPGFGPPPDFGPESGPHPSYGPGPEREGGDDRREGRGIPFRFLLLDTQGRVLQGAAGYQVNDVVPARVLQGATPIKVDGRVEVLAVQPPDQHPMETDLSPQDRAYLDIMRRALLVGTAIALAVAALLGVIFGSRITARLLELTHALRALRMGDPLEALPVRSRDEVGQLAVAFNHMSAELNRAHDELQQTNRTIRQQTEQLKELSIRDPLTQLYNRRHFDEHAATLYQLAHRNRRPLCVMLADLDHFKSINDTYSHSVGDEVLRRAAAILTENMRKSDVLARYGGEEFVAVFPECDLQNAVQRCEALRQAIERHPWHEVAPGLKVTMSIGLCDVDQLDSVGKMLSQADERLYEAKHAGRNRVMPLLSMEAA